jgi:threonylcarbamoyladenosine tRNA methylthiotransferase MtaB
LGSLQPHEITPEIIGLLCDPASPVCEHLHLSLQSGSDRVLGAMGRPYRRAAIEELFSRFSPVAGRINLGADIIVGFPAEDAAAFAATRKLIAASPLGYLHVFPYSPRPGTVAASWPDRVPAALKKERAAELAALGREKRAAFRAANRGRILEVLLETRRSASQLPPSGGWFGHSRNYLPVVIFDHQLPNETKLYPGEPIRIRTNSDNFLTK